MRNWMSNVSTRKAAKRTDEFARMSCTWESKRTVLRYLEWEWDPENNWKAPLWNFAQANEKIVDELKRIVRTAKNLHVHPSILRKPISDRERGRQLAENGIYVCEGPI